MLPSLLLLALLLSLPGCLSLAQLSRALEERHVTSCIYATAFSLVPTGIGMMHSISSTGGATLRECHEFR